MKFLAVAVFLVVVAYTSAGIGLPIAASRGALEGALGGKWIPDVPVADPLTAPVATPWAASVATPWAAAPLATSWGASPIAASRGALEGALGGKWIPDVPVAEPLTAPVATPWAASVATPWAASVAAPWTAAPLATPWSASWASPLAASPLPAAPGLALGWNGVSARGALEGALGGQWIPDVLPGH